MIKNRSNQGFTLVEMLVVTAIFLIIIALGAQVIQLATLSSQTNTNINEVEQNARVAMKFIERDITNSGNDFIEGTPANGANPASTTGPLVATTAFLQIRGGSTANVPVAATPNAQGLYCLLPVNRRDNLGNGIAGGGFTAIQNGSSDRLTVGYKDEFLVSGTTQRFQDMALTMPIDPTPLSVGEYTGTWDATTKKVTLANVIFDAADSSYIKYALDVTQLKQGDLMEFRVNGSSVPAVLGMVTAVDNVAKTITFGPDALGFNTLQGSPVMNPNFYPLDQLAPPYAMAGQVYSLTRANIYTYFVDTTTKELIRRRYKYVPMGSPISFIDDTVCQNVERFRLTYNVLTPGDSTATPPLLPVLNNATSLDPDTTPTDYNQLRNIRRVNVNLILRSSNLDKRNKQPARYALNASFTPRNTAYVANEFAQ